MREIRPSRSMRGGELFVEPSMNNSLPTLLKLRFALVAVATVAAGFAQRGDPNNQRGDKSGATPFAPAEQQRMFHVPPGFEVELVAAEPQISKPINLAFDAA